VRLVTGRPGALAPATPRCRWKRTSG